MYKLTFLGTSSGTPTKYRNVSGLAVECINPQASEGKGKKTKGRPWLLIDCGEGTQHQILHTKLSYHQLQAICITHVHGDHCYGLAGLLSSMAMLGRKTPLKLIAPKAISKMLDTFTITTELYFPYAIEFIAIEDLLTQQGSDDKQQASVELALNDNHRINIEIISLSHRVDSFAFRLEQTIEYRLLNSQRLLAEGIEPSNIWGRLKHGVDAQLDDGTLLKSVDYVDDITDKLNIVISGDNDNPELLADAVKGARLLVHESTYTQAVADKIHARPDAFDPQHSTAKQVAEFAQSNQVPNLILTHFSARYQLFDDVTAKLDNMGHIRVEVEEYYQGKFKQQFWLAEDFDEYEVDADGVRCVGFKQKAL